MGISRQEGTRIAERAAWARHGEKNEWWYRWGRKVVPPVAAVLAVGTGVVWALSWLWQQTSALFAGDVRLAGPTSGAAWVVGVLLFGVTVVAFRGVGHRYRSLGELLLTGVGIAVMWAGFGLFVVGAAS